ncbi:fatty acid alpha-hydroxylase [Mortierella alpina]|uniref:Ceramide very long chain fatty acid hydroxylase n=1 Tax=Mortierella alpina TaxID=64518 RepID=A0A9P6JCQ2_MORAP|nr:fatty acid alpha-hydroxylase [Mortierella alpina]
MSSTFSPQEIALHKSEKSCWVVHDGKVFDVTDFVADHPGGEEYILDHAGQDISAIMKDELEHLHSESAYEVLNDFLIGTVSTDSQQTTTTTSSTASVGASEGIQKQPSVAAASNKDEEDEMAQYLKPTDIAADKKIKFLDLSRPLLSQLWHSDFSKAFYLEQVHIPRHLSRPAQIFGSPYLEVFTKTPWYIIPIFWLPIVAYNVHRSRETGLTQDQTAAFFVTGVFLWSLAEYVIHRFLFHLDDLLPDSTFWLTAHFLLHGIHHYVPMDRMRLVMPPALGVALAIPLNKLGHSLFAQNQAYAVMAGAFFGYILYDLTHYYLHHAKVFKIHFKEMKTYHLAHHYKNFEGGYGITSKMWDRVFNTELKL